MDGGGQEEEENEDAGSTHKMRLLFFRIVLLVDLSVPPFARLEDT